VDGRPQVGEVVGGCLDEQDVTVRADGADHVQVKRYFLGPTAVGRGIAGTAVLIDFAGATVRGRARRQAVLRTVDGEIALCSGVIVGVEYGDGLAAACCGRGQVVGGLQLSRSISIWRDRRRHRGRL